MEQDLPGFLIIGAMKSGTTGLYWLLRLHSQITMSRIKEPNFFNRPACFGGTWDRGLDWYRGLFNAGSGLKGEASTGYTKYPRDPSVVNRIYQTLPHARFIYLVRNPIHRALSHYLHSVLDGHEDRPIHVAILQPTDGYYVTTGLYHMQLEQYLRKFPPERFCVVTAESLWKNRTVVFERVLRFLKVDPLSVDVNTVEVERRNATRDRLQSFLKGEMRPRNDAQERLRRALRGSTLPPGANAATVAGALGFGDRHMKDLANQFRDDVLRLGRFLRQPLDEWRANFGC